MENASQEVKLVKVEIEVAKESKEICDFTHDLIKDIRAGKDVSEIVANNLKGLMDAIGGYDMLGDEMKSSARNATIGYAGIKIADALS